MKSPLRCSWKFRRLLTVYRGECRPTTLTHASQRSTNNNHLSSVEYKISVNLTVVNYVVKSDVCQKSESRESVTGGAFNLNLRGLNADVNSVSRVSVVNALKNKKK